MARMPKPQRIWYQPHSYSSTGMQVIENVKTGNQPFGFSRALYEKGHEPADIWRAFGGCYGRQGI
jgi:hypothetical protein